MTIWTQKSGFSTWKENVNLMENRVAVLVYEKVKLESFENEVNAKE